jgi:AcrR family transcriptional regulator
MHDYERISIAAIAREAGCSVGALYARFRDKNAFLQSVIASGFHALTVESTHDLARERWHGSSQAKTIAGLVHHVVTQLSRDQAAGAVRAAVKLATIRPAAAEPLVGYRSAVADRAVGLLAPHPSPAGAAQAVRTAVQVVFATVIDATLPSADSHRPRQRQMTETLTDLMAAYLRQAQRGPGAADKQDRSDESPQSKEPQSRAGLLRPEAKTLAKATDTTRQTRATRSGAARPALKDPKNVRPARPEEAGPKTAAVGRRRYRLL